MIKKTFFSMVLILFCLCLLASNGFEPVNAAASLSKDSLVLVTGYTKELAIEMKYASYNNFVGKTLYPSPTCVLTRGTLDKLIKANNIVLKQGYRIKIWDAYRPLSVQKIMWEATPNKNYVANPYRSGSKHNRGAAVDVTLVDKDGKELNMPTGFDNFTAAASPSYKGMSQEQRKNLNILSSAMTSAGFTPLSHEWWHFDDKDWKNYKIQNLPLSKFDKTNHTLQSSVIENLKCIKGTNTTQLIVVTSESSNSSYAVINTYEKTNNGWVNNHKNMDGYIGLRGFLVNKQEGDKKTPVGAFGVGTCFTKNNNIQTGLTRYQYDSSDVWVDDSTSAFYNTHQREPSNGRWKSAENFSRMKNGIYDVFFEIKYNPERIKNKGSAIFFHIANPAMQIKYTSGCVSTDRDHLLSIVKWLEAGKSPVILMGPLSMITKY